ncbi:MAG TPA: hypothetical protein VI911_07365 [Patescibacteria group bacterium]|nr:hypothetical protein [Patescibacteria group bacterium]
MKNVVKIISYTCDVCKERILGIPVIITVQRTCLDGEGAIIYEVHEWHFHDNDHIGGCKEQFINLLKTKYGDGQQTDKENLSLV